MQDKKRHILSARVFSFCKTCLLFLKEYLLLFNVREGNADLLVKTFDIDVFEKTKLIL